MVVPEYLKVSTTLPPGYDHTVLLTLIASPVLLVLGSVISFLSVPFPLPLLAGRWRLHAHIPGTAQSAAALFLGFSAKRKLDVAISDFVLVFWQAGYSCLPNC